MSKLRRPLVALSRGLTVVFALCVLTFVVVNGAGPSCRQDRPAGPASAPSQAPTPASGGATPTPTAASSPDSAAGAATSAPTPASAVPTPASAPAPASAAPHSAPDAGAVFIPSSKFGVIPVGGTGNVGNRPTFLPSSKSGIVDLAPEPEPLQPAVPPPQPPTAPAP